MKDSHQGVVRYFVHQNPAWPYESEMVIDLDRMETNQGLASVEREQFETDCKNLISDRARIISAINAYIDAARPLMYKPSFSTKSPGHKSQSEFMTAQRNLIEALAGVSHD